MMINTCTFLEILREDLAKELPDGYPCNVPKALLIKDIEEIVLTSMNRWIEESAKEEE